MNHLHFSFKALLSLSMRVCKIVLIISLFLLPMNMNTKCKHVEYSNLHWHTLACDCRKEESHSATLHM